MTLIGSIAGFTIKKATNVTTFAQVFIHPWIYIGTALYICAALINIYLLRYLPYSTVLPLTALTYIWTLAISNAFLAERVTFVKVTGVILILVGAAFIGHGSIR